MRSGQVILTWDEDSTVEGITYQVFASPHPITPEKLENAYKVGQHIEAGSACDWWQNPASFQADAPSDRSHGFIIDGIELDPASGLFVHTVTPKDPDEMYFAVLPSNASATHIQMGANSLATPIKTHVAPPQPIQLKAAPASGSASGKSLTLVLHGLGGGRDPHNTSNFLLFGDARQGWRQGLARKFTVTSNSEGIIIEPRDWMWIGRPLLHSKDPRDHALAINTWWYGCNDRIYDAKEALNGVVVNYTEEHLLYLVRWAQKEYGTDPNKTHIKGLSMGGSGAISMGFHHPETFATIFSSVPIVAYTKRAGIDGKSNLPLLNALCGRTCDETVMTNEGISIIERMNSERIAREHIGDLPFLVFSNGRNDRPIPWINNPPFYHALNEAKRGFVSYWNNGGHDMWKSVPDDVTNYYTSQPIQLNKSYPAFSNNSTNRKPGNGSRKDGDATGWINRGLYWSDVIETADRWQISLHARGDFLPSKLTLDLTPRNLQKFKIMPNEILLVNGQQQQASSTGTLTVNGVTIHKGAPTHLHIQRL
ncbi:alpha/beta hydrolase-fold protein [Coraliomargarita sp. SDUM461004]|uniref:Alpha/beta hydrolase-fold protein n=2 Tax=Thalassobacterium sedimentorum TaxID=3041258 RepID=A0ABU1AIT6_9BACT|nr:alpha/beta hydrolase-fold protein [Coraliomargarita sp. SDUM461004]